MATNKISSKKDQNTILTAQSLSQLKKSANKLLSQIAVETIPTPIDSNNKLRITIDSKDAIFAAIDALERYSFDIDIAQITIELSYMPNSLFGGCSDCSQLSHV